MKAGPFVFEFYDFSPVGLSEEDIGELRQLFPEINDEEDLIKKFCETVEKEVDIGGADRSKVMIMGEERSPRLFSYGKKEIFVKGHCGVINFAVNDTKVTVIINSRFSRNNAFFLLHLFEIAFGIKGIVYSDMDIAGKRERSWDYMIMMLFLRQFHDAYKGGIYKEYRDFEYNDPAIKGRVDISRHIKENLMNNGKVAYSTREYTPDNYINILILKAFERLLTIHRSAMTEFMSQDDIVKKGFTTLGMEIEGAGNYPDHQVIKNTGKKIVKNIFKKYEALRVTSIFILKRYGVNGLVQMDQTTGGILVDMPGLWERYLHKLLFSRIDENGGAEYRQDKFPILYEDRDGIRGDSKRDVKPDHLVTYRGRKYVFDAKYKMYWSKALSDEDWKKCREDVFQVMSYMYLFRCRYGGIVFPYDADDNAPEISSFFIGQERMDDRMILIPVRIPRDDDYSAYKENIGEEFDEKVRILKEIFERAPAADALH